MCVIKRIIEVHIKQFEVSLHTEAVGCVFSGYRIIYTRSCIASAVDINKDSHLLVRQNSIDPLNNIELLNVSCNI